MGSTSAKTGYPDVDEVIEQNEQGAGLTSSSAKPSAFKEDGEDVFMGFQDANWIDPEIVLDLNQEAEGTQMDTSGSNPFHPDVDGAITDADLLRADMAAGYQGEWGDLQQGVDDTNSSQSSDRTIIVGSPEIDPIDPDLTAASRGSGGNAEYPDTDAVDPDLAAPLQEGGENAGLPETNPIFFDIGPFLQEGNLEDPDADVDLLDLNAGNEGDSQGEWSGITDTDLLIADLNAASYVEENSWAGFPDEDVLDSEYAASLPELGPGDMSNLVGAEMGHPDKDDGVKEVRKGQYFQGLSEVETSGDPRWDRAFRDEGDD